MTTQPDRRRVWGVDVSHWNGLVDFQTAKANGCHFVIIKACDGSVPTRWFQENRAGAKAAGIPWGAYVWLYPGSKVPVGTQVNAWWNLVKDDYPPLGVWIDFEWTSYGGKPDNPTTGDLISALDKFTALSGRKPGIYTAKGYTDQYARDFRRWDEYRLWVAHYDVTIPLLPSGATKWTLHQWTSAMDGSLAPSENLGLDGNYYFGTAEQFAAEFGGVVTPPGGTMYGVVTAGALNVRNGPGTGYGIIGVLLSGDLVTGEIVNGWWHLTDATRNGVPVLLSDNVTTLRKRAELVGDVYASGGFIVATEPPPASTWPEYYTLEAPDGTRQRYNRA